MRLLIHDFTGHPFPVELSRALAARGHHVHHVYCASLHTTPQGKLTRQPDDPTTFSIEGLHVPRYDRERMLLRWRGDRAYGRAAVDAFRRFRPDAVLSSNTPLDAQAMLQRAARATRTPVVYWLQDLIGEASYRLLRTRIPLAGSLIGRFYQRLERALLRGSAATVLITDDFRPLLHGMGIPDDRLHTIENWSTLDDMPVRPQDNPWSRAHGLAGKQVFVYAGTLGMKHNPALLLELGRRFRDHPDVHVVVCSQGRGSDWIRQQAHAEGLDRVQVVGFQPFGDVPDMLATATVLTAILEPDASVFSVPSKVLSYLCAARPLLLAVPPENLAARLVVREQAGRVVPPDAVEAFVEHAAALLASPSEREAAGRNARRYAERAFALGPITDRFENMLGDVAAASHTAPAAAPVSVSS